MSKEKIVLVNNVMQKGTYTITEEMGKNFDERFKPDYTPKEMLKMGVFGGKYFNDVAETDEYPSDWFSNAKLSGIDNPADYNLNYFKIKASASLKEWRDNNWITEYDPRGWFEWYCRYYMGRRIPEEDERQIKRWMKSARFVKRNPSDKIKQTLLHWARKP